MAGEGGSARVVVYHAGYGCDTGCCGHVVELDGDEHFEFEHPWDVDEGDEEALKEWARDLVVATVGAEHAADLDWANCRITTNC